MRNKQHYTVSDGYNLGRGLVSGVVVGVIVTAIPVVIVGTIFEVPAHVRNWWNNRMRKV